MTGCPFLKHGDISISRRDDVNQGISLGEKKVRFWEVRMKVPLWQGAEWAAPGRPPPLEARVVIFHLL